MTTTISDTSIADRFVTVTLRSGVHVTGERTECPQLMIAPVLQPDGITDRLALIHIPTRYMLPPPVFGDVRTLRELAGKVKDLNWDITDQNVADLKPAVVGYLEARKKMEFGEGEKFALAYPDGWQGDDSRIPGTADAMVAWMLDGFQATEERMFGSGADTIPSKLPDGSSNPAWREAVRTKVDAFAIAYILAALRRVAPETADHVTAFVAQQWDAGDSLGEWVWEWRRNIEMGEPLRLPAVPSPAPEEGALP